MKIKPEQLEMLRAAIVPLDTPEMRARYIEGRFPRADRCKDKNVRYRWDLLHASRFATGVNLQYLNDTHIDTALRQIVPPLETK